MGGGDLAAAVGGARGLVENALPGALFVVVYTVTKELTPSLWAGVGSAVVLAVLRLLRRETVQHAVGGLVGIAIGAWFAHRSGRAEAFYLPSLIKNAGFGAAYALSALVRWPILGVALGPLLGEGLTGWRSQPTRMRAYTLATWVWAGLFAIRLAVQVPLYAAGAVTTLGTANIFLGLPLYGLTIWITWRLLRVPKAEPADEPAGLDGVAAREAPAAPAGPAAPVPLAKPEA
ncbi:DUF3159 domain-containing protein [Motilibacter sp. E257]|uniref:DUF3159 domain-containing protein n=1 Tax=Motilibacter deserti TaxID=2714956 RepID=A0ABX0GW29_9ACTN|nr:DUF3159 domain-containing protein [Motilibacter deserti]NHC13844.1 DUF3159 domain-containing protein [Motilibacter deserti]